MSLWDRNGVIQTAASIAIADAATGETAEVSEGALAVDPQLAKIETLLEDIHNLMVVALSSD